MIVLSPCFLYPLIFAGALVISIVSIPGIIYIAKSKKIFDVPDHTRKLHIATTPSLGGISIVLSYVLACSFFISPQLFDKWNIILVSSFLLLVTGITDDLVNVSPAKKLLAQFLASIITVYFADIRISSLHGILGIYELPLWASIAFTTIGCMFVTNAINLIDGIDGLAGALGSLGAGCLGAGLALTGNAGAACIAFSLMGGLVGFLRFNLPPARIFMGDTGSLVTGFTLAVLSVLLVRSYNINTPLGTVVKSQGGVLLVALSILFVPIFDSFRVFLNRIRKGGSPFAADRTHLHHMLLDAGCTHLQAVGILVAANILIIAIALLLQDVNPNAGIAAIAGIATLLFGMLYLVRKKKMGETRQVNTTHS